MQKIFGTAAGIQLESVLVSFYINSKQVVCPFSRLLKQNHLCITMVLLPVTCHVACWHGILHHT